MSGKNELASRRIITVTEEELSRIVLDIHDGPVQNLFAALSLITRLQNEISKVSFEELQGGVTDLIPIVTQVEKQIEITLQDIKHFVGAFRSPGFHRRTFKSVCEGLIFQHEQWSNQIVEFDIQSLPEGDIDLHVKIALYRILQEALSNAYRHSGSEHQWVKVWYEHGHVCMEVIDDGRGFEPPPLDGPEATEHIEHIGLRGMRDRVAILDGEFYLHSAPGEGTRITVRVPVSPND